MKHRAESLSSSSDIIQSKIRATTTEVLKSRFRDNVFDKETLQAYVDSYSNSEPYKHGVIQDLISDELLRSVRTEVLGNLQFTLKETDIYKIYQSGDLANLDGLDSSSLSRLPSLLKLRDALYSSAFREYLATITKCGPLSGKKTDMAINIYTPGCHLLCHDDMIGSRRVSYILYLTDPENPWKEGWGGALRLYPVSDTLKEGAVAETSNHSVSIPPAFNQLSFFAVEPGKSLHDVEEVYHRKSGDAENDGGRVRVAISGWYHIPQTGELGYERGMEEKLALKSSLSQLHGKGDDLELPKPLFRGYAVANNENGEAGDNAQGDAENPLPPGDFTDDDFNLLLKFLAPSYLTPDTLSELADIFREEYTVQLESILSHSFANSLRKYVESLEHEPLPLSSTQIEAQTRWLVARPPYKHRFLYQQARNSANVEGDKRKTPIQLLLEDYLPSEAFRKWLSILTGCQLTSHQLIARRFRKGSDYTLATGFEGSERLEITLGITPSVGWDEASKAEAFEAFGVLPGQDVAYQVGGYEMYMSGEGNGEEEEEDKGEGESEGEGKGEGGLREKKSTDSNDHQGAKPTGKKAKSDPAIYKAVGSGEDDGVLCSTAAGWNRLSIVLRDRGVLKFVKYVSREAPGDRWDVTGEFDVAEDEEEEEEWEGIEEAEMVEEPVQQEEPGPGDSDDVDPEDQEDIDDDEEPSSSD
ncbi:MAG: hypothetical protein M1829_002387 [Trizodia sp. TS-e1964]|nr:MAG: hypothetical protein M1829_002387 [Trizodia sp. TS-e1964]